MYQPGDPSVNDWLNELLKRTEFMPFAPVTLWEHTDKLFVDPKGALDAARFMTITFHCTPPDGGTMWGRSARRQHCPAPVDSPGGQSDLQQNR